MAPAHPPRPGRTPETAPDHRRRNPRSRRAILDASLRLVGELGYARLTIEAIAARAGVGKQTIYRWWPSKAAVLLDAFTAARDDAGTVGLPDTGDLATDLKRVLRATVDEFTDPEFEAPYRALAVAGADDPALAAEIVDRVSRPGREVYVDRLRAAQRAGQLATDADPALVAELLLGPFFQRWLTRSAPLTHAFTDHLVDLVLRGLRPPDPAGPPRE